MKNCIHSTSIIDKKTKLGNQIHIGPYSTIGPNVEIKNNVKIYSNVNIQGYTLIDEGTEIIIQKDIKITQKLLKNNI